MANDNNNIVVAGPAVTGGFYSAPLTTPAIDSIADGIPSVAVDHGLVGEDGLVVATNRDQGDIKDWRGNTVATTTNSYSKTLKLTLLESLKAENAELVLGEDNVTVIPGDATHGERLVLKHTAKASPHRSFYTHMFTDNDADLIQYVPDGQITELGDQTYKPDGATGYEITVTAYPDADGVVMYEFSDNGVKVTT